MSSVSPYYLQELKSANALADVVSSYVQLKRSGAQMVGLCPFHSEKTPSFQVSPSKEMFYCFGCGAGGDVISFIRRIENLDYMEALTLLAQRAGMPPPERDRRKGEIPNERLMEVNRETAKFYFAQLVSPQGKAGLSYLYSRGVTNESIKRFGLGYAPNDWNRAENHLRSLGFTQKEILAAGVVRENAANRLYDVFRNRIMFPILDLRGNIIAFGGRIMGADDKGPKYLNTGDTPIFSKSRQTFALNFAKNSKNPYLLLCEGYMDVVSLHQASFDNAVATLGTALTFEQAKLLGRYTKEVLIAYDADGAGRKATDRASEILRQAGLSVRVLNLPDAKDPDEYIKRFGVEKFHRLLENALTDTAYKVQTLKQQHDLDTQDGKLAFLEAFVKVMASLDNPLERDVFIADTAKQLEVQRDALVKRVSMVDRRRERRQERRQLTHFALPAPATTNKERRIDAQRMRYPKYAAAEDKILGLLQQHPDCYRMFASQLTPELFVTDENRRLLEILISMLQAGESVDLSSLGEMLTLEQMDKISAVVRDCEEMRIRPENMQEYICVLASFSHRQSAQTVADMSQDEFGDFISRLGKNKT